MIKNIFLVGNPGVGKTTLLQNIAGSFATQEIGGFYTEEIRDKRTRVGFRMETFSGRSGTLSHVKYKTGPQVGKYRVDVSAFENICVSELERALQISTNIFIDEIGKMELYSNTFKNILLRCLDSNKPVIATVMSRPHPFVDKLKERNDVRIVRVTFENRDNLLDLLITEIETINFNL
jgi:nucleoside-triphosphatase